jgi:hypothetical protein
MNTSKLIGKEVEEFLSEQKQEEDKVLCWELIVRVFDRSDDVEIPEGAEFLVVVTEDFLATYDSYYEVLETRLASSFSQVEQIVTEIRDKSLADQYLSKACFVVRGNWSDARLAQLAAKLGLVKMNENGESPENTQPLRKDEPTTEVGGSGVK